MVGQIGVFGTGVRPGRSPAGPLGGEVSLLFQKVEKRVVKCRLGGEGRN